MRAASLIAVAGVATAILGYGAGRVPAKSFTPVYFDGTVAAGDHHFGLNTPRAGRIEELVWTQDGPGGGIPDEKATFAVLRRLPDAGFETLCEIPVPCTLSEGQHVYPDGGSTACQPVLAARDHLDYTILTENCGQTPRGFLATTFEFQ